ncbi:cyclic nucleotide-gated cation channel beta-1-like [Salvia hispanica]|uniref:cyclic nucleotide-gated cation channel beta-1-like n=1 Tax=Salvia hispanica TaxID=49212 RepID=UPI00200939FA|nr:cyclic nucleotide-gated cation channel beta-1-like [Salvia hispanica]
MQRNPMARSTRGKNPPKEKAKKTSAEATSSNPTAEKPPAPLLEENPVPTPAVVQPQPEITPENPTTTLASATATNEEVLDPEEVVREFMEKYENVPKASKFFANISEAFRKQEQEFPPLTPLTIPPRPQTFIETPTAQALPTHQENPQILPETLTQETNPPNTIPQTETEPLAEPSVNEEESAEEDDDKMDTKESEREEEGGERVEQEQILDEEATGSGDEGEKREGIDGGEGAEEGKDKVEETEGVKETERQDLEKLMGDEEGRVGKEGERLVMRRLRRKRRLLMRRLRRKRRPMHAIHAAKHPGESVHCFIKFEQKLTIYGAWLPEKFVGEGCPDAFVEVHQTQSPSVVPNVQVHITALHFWSVVRLGLGRF